MEGISIIEDYDGCVDGHGVLWYCGTAQRD